MAWIEYHEGLRDHWKIQRLADRLSIEYPAALGHVSCLWLWLIPNAPDGNVSHFTDKELSRAARISGEIETKKILMECELLDASGKIHDWSKHGIKYLKSTLLRVKRHRERKRNCNVTVALLKRSRNVTVTSTLPNLTLPNLKTKTPPYSPPVGDDLAFQKFWTAYPKKKSKAQAEKAWSKLKPSEALQVAIFAALEKGKKSHDWTKDGGQFVPYPASWLNAHGWEDEFEEPQRTEQQRRWGAAAPIPGKYAGVSELVEN